MTVVLAELLAAKHAVSSAIDGPGPGMRRPFAPWLEAMVRPGDQVVEESTEKFQVLLADRDEAEAAAFVDACKRAFEEMDPGGELIAAWAISSDDRLDVAVRLAEARLAGRRDGWIRSVAVR